MSPRMVVWVAADNLGKRVLEFDWHQVARKSFTVGQGFGRNRGPDQHKGFAFEEASFDDSP